MRCGAVSSAAWNRLDGYAGLTLKLGVLQSEGEGRRMVMRNLSVAHAKAHHLSTLLDALELGEDLEISRHGIHVARLTRPGRGVWILATLSNLAIIAVRLDGIWLITKGICAPSHGTKVLLRLMGWREPAEAQALG